MANVDDLDKQRAALLEYGLTFFHKVRSRKELYSRFGLCFNQLQGEMIDLARQGLITPAAAEAWSWYSVAVPAMLKVAFLEEPKWDTRELELQLQEALRKALRRTTTVEITKPGSAIEPAPPEVDVDLPETAGAVLPPKPH